MHWFHGYCQETVAAPSPLKRREQGPQYQRFQHSPPVPFQDYQFSQLL